LFAKKLIGGSAGRHPIAGGHPSGYEMIFLSCTPDHPQVTADLQEPSIPPLSPLN